MQDYEEAVKQKDLARALRFLKSLDNPQIQKKSSSSASIDPYLDVDNDLSLLRPEKDWEVLDACLNADDMKLYIMMAVLEGPRDVTPTILKSSTGLEASKLAPKKWGLSGTSTAVLVAFLGGVSFLLSKDIDVRPNLTAILGLAMLDSIFLGGSCLAQISSYHLLASI
ncbi:hypothetical protein C5167_045769 [Papaver somniferum]|uniref:Uncharacterized protein n=1 Tax=Papaver somniferum TaxID=3469 RepID=A0A4Y7LFI2_PAPSO|nr:hypothetical protein C5167_045769 [Papaver somniferum]